MEEVFLLGGRGFTPPAEGTTVDQDAYVTGILFQHGIDKVIEEGGDVVGAVFKARCVSQLVSGLLVEVDKEWTLESALANAAAFGKLRTPAEKNVIFGCLRGLLKGFSIAGIGSSAVSPTASETPATTTSRKTTTDPSRATRPLRASATGMTPSRRSRTSTTSG